jgi:nicotinate-nucleotide adenylyltransferase
MRLGIFGGSFDPVHNGHIALAQACQHQEGLDEIWFMPTAVQPLKQQGPHATDAQRLEMLRLATWPEPSWRVSTLEIDRGGLSFTVDTLRQLGEQLPEAVLFFLLGADAVQDVPHWREPRVIFSLATPLVVHRAGEPEPDLEMLRTFCSANKQPQRIEMPAVNISSSEIRRRIAAGQSLDGLVPPTVAAYITAHNVYR